MSIPGILHSATTGWLRPSAFLLALLISVAGCTTSDGGARRVSSSHLPKILDEVRETPGKRLSGEAACERSITARPSDFPFKLFFAGLFNVPEESAAQSFCAAIIEAVIAGDLTKSDIDVFKKPSALRGKGPLGTLLRELMVAHERLYAQQAQRPPQAQSCGCGQ